MNGETFAWAGESVMTGANV